MQNLINLIKGTSHVLMLRINLYVTHVHVFTCLCVYVLIN